MVDWSMLPCDILDEIALKLDQVEDFLCFSVICHSWNDASSLVKTKWNAKWNAKTVMPWLLLAENTNENPDYYRKIYNLGNNKCYRLKLPETFGARCWGSLDGWIIMQTYDFQMHLINPFTKVRITSLPYLLTMPHQPSDDPLEIQEMQEWFLDAFVKRCVVLKMPCNRHTIDNDNDNDDNSGGDLLIAATHGEYEYLSFARPGDQAWTYVYKDVADVFCWGGLIYFVGFDGKLMYCDMNRFEDHRVLQVIEYVPPFRRDLDGFDRLSLLDLNGDLVMVLRRKKGDATRNLGYCSFGFQVYRLDNKITKWVEIKDLGDFSIFVGQHAPMVVANKCIQKNCIYFTDDQGCFYWRREPGFGGHDMGVYNMSSKDITQYYQGDDTRSPICPPIFFLPKF